MISDEQLLQMWINVADFYKLVDPDKLEEEQNESMWGLYHTTRERLEVGPQPSLSAHMEEIHMGQLATAYIHAVIRELKEDSVDEHLHDLWIRALKTSLGAISWPEPPYSCDPTGDPCDCLE